MLLEAARRDRIGENEEDPVGAELLIEPLNQEAVLVIEHGRKPDPAHVTIGRAINRITEPHVIGRHRFRDRAGRPAGLKEAPRYFLSRSDLREGTVFTAIEINLERFLVRSDFHLWVH